MGTANLAIPTNGEGKRESGEDRSNELEACQSVCVSVSWRSPNAHTVKSFHRNTTEMHILIMRDYSVAVIILALQAGDRGSTPRSRILTALRALPRSRPA